MPGQRNPDWSWDEQILAFELFLRIGAVGANHPDVIKLSNHLRSLPLHSIATRQDTFRNPAGVARKLADIRTHQPGYGGKPTSGSRLDTLIWKEFGNDPASVNAVTERIRSHAQIDAPPDADEEELAEIHNEGRLVVRTHRSRERSKNLRRNKIQQVKRVYGNLLCEACMEVPHNRYGPVGDEVLECHHLVPLAVSGPTETKLKDVVLLCPTCHRVAHRIRPWPTLKELRAISSQ